MQVINLSNLEYRADSNEVNIFREGASGVLLVFSYSDRASWEELPGLIQRTVMQV